MHLHEKKLSFENIRDTIFRTNPQKSEKDNGSISKVIKTVHLKNINLTISYCAMCFKYKGIQYFRIQKDKLKIITTANHISYFIIYKINVPNIPINI